MNVLVLNAGSSSLRYQLLNVETSEVIARGLCERIGIPDSILSHKAMGVDHRFIVDIPDHRTAITLIMGMLMNAQSVDHDLSTIEGIGHRIVHGGVYFDRSVLVDDEVVATIEKLSPLAPLHNPAACSVIQACRDIMPNVPNVTTFDTAFHSTIPQFAHVYPIPYSYYEIDKIRKYGAHGTSHRYVSKVAADFLGHDLADLKMITAHVGNGASLCAVKGGISVDTTMGFTPLDGLMMGTRSGSIDPAIVTYLLKNTSNTADDVDRILNRESGLRGVSGVSSDLREVLSQAAEGEKNSVLAVDMYCYSVRKNIGQMLMALGDLDVLVFTAGVGENSAVVRERSVRGLENSLGIEIDHDRNEAVATADHDEPIVISTDASAVTVLVIRTNEELMIAHDVKALLED